MKSETAKRAVDLTIAALVIALSSPLVILAMLAIWLQDFRSPIYIAWRAGRGGKPFRMYKLRSMVVDADKTGVSSTGANDQRITAIGQLVRRCKLDELPQLWNVVLGQMSLVGPRPNVLTETAQYTAAEQRLLSVRPGVTDFASIVFSDEGDILADAPDPDLAYNQLIRPGKSLLGLFYVDHQSIMTDLRLIALTGLSLISKTRARTGVAKLLRARGATDDLITLSLRNLPLEPSLPPGAADVVAPRLSSADR